ncbi:hypothetical protein [Bacillus cereus group sp. BfR-BA-01363]|uniref:hypothetical protein n=1 Tax=unclassified Bacillus cereus group TaxID=2750818 RepID=UPI001F586C6D|nr:hypothetical protein [Bacillus cereus group sp. BfR-BA-01363]MDX5853563.1 hypothetical protein [Bacillus cereus group sp. BfR-BA-01363]
MKEVLDVLKKKEAEIKKSIDSCKTVGDKSLFEWEMKGIQESIKVIEESLEKEIKFEDTKVEEGPYGGTPTIMSTLPVGTKFHVCNGHWNGEIVEKNGMKYILISEDNLINLSEYPDYKADINIKSIYTNREELDKEIKEKRKELSELRIKVSPINRQIYLLECVIDELHEERMKYKRHT